MSYHIKRFVFYTCDLCGVVVQKDTPEMGHICFPEGWGHVSYGKLAEGHTHKQVCPDCLREFNVALDNLVGRK